MVCQKCGIENKEDAKFCSACGSEIVKDATEPLPLNVNKAATISALFAPIGIVASTLNSLIFSGLANNVIFRYTGYENYLTWSQLINFFTSVSSIAIYFGLYLIFTKNYRDKLPLFLFLLAPGCNVISTPISNSLNFLIRLIGVETTTRIIGTGVTILVMPLVAAAAFFIVKMVFEKILSKK